MKHSHTTRKSVGLALGLVALVALVGVLSAPSAAAPPGPLPWGAPLTVALSSYNNGYSSVVTDSRGYTYVFYESQDPSNLGVVYLNVTRYYDYYPFSFFYPGPVQAQGTWTVNASSETPAFGIPPSAKIDPDTGTLYVSWERSSVVSGSTTIMVSSSTTMGESWSTTVAHPLTTTNANDLRPALAVAPGGRLTVAFTESWSTGPVAGNVSVAAVHSPDGGSTFTPAVNISTGGYNFLTGDYFGAPSLVADSHGRAYIAYTHETYNLFPTSYAVYASWSDGAEWATPALLNPNSTWALNPSIALDASGAVHVGWLDYRMVYNQLTVHMRTSTDRGASWGGDTLVMRGAANPDASAVPVLASFADTVEVTMIPAAASTLILYTYSQNDGMTWAGLSATGVSPAQPAFLSTSPGGNNTYWATYTDVSSSTRGVYLSYWEAPPSTPTITAVGPAAGGLVVRWTASPETDIAYYEVSRSVAGSGTWTVVADVVPSTTSYTDTGLVNGTYAYQVVAVDSLGVASLASNAVAGTVGVTVAQLQNEIASLQNQIAALKGTADANNATLAQLQSELAGLQSQLNAVQSQQATQAVSYVNLGFEILVVVLLALILLIQIRRPKHPVQVLAPTPGQAVPQHPEDEL